MSSIDSLRTLVSFILPLEINDYFDIVDVQCSNNDLHIFLDEQAQVPFQYESWEVKANGFFPEVLIRDFPIRDRRYSFMFAVGVGLFYRLMKVLQDV